MLKLLDRLRRVRWCHGGTGGALHEAGGKGPDSGGAATPLLTLQAAAAATTITSISSTSGVGGNEADSCSPALLNIAVVVVQFCPGVYNLIRQQQRNCLIEYTDTRHSCKGAALQVTPGHLSGTAASDCIPVVK